MWIHSTPPHGEGDESEDSSRVTVVTERQDESEDSSRATARHSRRRVYGRSREKPDIKNNSTSWSTTSENDL
jgi:hypothetical protein